VLRRAAERGAGVLAEGVRVRLSEPPGGTHDAPWVESGRLRDGIGTAVESDVDGARAAVGSSDPAAVPQELGTVHMRPRPFLAPTAAEMGEEAARVVGVAVAAALRGEIDGNPLPVQDVPADTASAGSQDIALQRKSLAGTTTLPPKGGAVLAGDHRSNPNIVKVSDSPSLQRLHPDSTYESDPGAKRSLDRVRRMSTQDIIDSLRPENGNKEALKVKPNGVIVNGNTRIKVLQERGVDVNSLPREFVPSAGAFPELGTPKSGRGGGGGGSIDIFHPKHGPGNNIP